MFSARRLIASTVALGLAGSAPANAGSVDAVCASLAGPGVKAMAQKGSCRVTGELRPVPGSQIGFALWLPPEAAWTGRMVMLGNGGYSSRLPEAAMGAELARGSAVVATDTGHQGDGPEFARGRPQTIVDWGWRAVHLTAITARTVISRFYGRGPRYRYFNGCSTGGHQAMTEAQRFPLDFDGIVAGAPGAARVRLNAGFLWQYLSNHPRGDDLHAILDRSDLALLQETSIGACRAANGGPAGGLAGDAWLNNPMLCRFDPSVLGCPAGVVAGMQERLIHARVCGSRHLGCQEARPAGQPIWPNPASRTSPLVPTSGGYGHSVMPLGRRGVSISVATWRPRTVG